MGQLERTIRAISPVLAVLMMIAVAIAGSLVVYAWIMGYIDLSTEQSGEAITIQNIFNDDDDLLVYVHNIGEGVAQLDEDECLYVNGILAPCTISGVTVSDDIATLAQGETATLRYVGGAALPGEKVKIKVTTLHGTPAEKYAYPAGTAGLPPGTVIWNRTYGGAWNDWAYAVVETSDGGYALAGNTYSFGAGEQDFWLVKTDSYGNIEWNKTYGGTDWDEASSLVATSDGGYAIVGSTESFGAVYSDFWLVKTDEFGNMEWNQTYGGTEANWAHSLVVTSDGGYAIAGTSRHDFWLVKTDEFGNAEWNRTYGGPDRDGASSVVVTSDGGYAIAGSTRSSDTEEYDFLLVKADEFGNMEWNRTYGGLDDESPSSLVVTSDGGYAIAGAIRYFENRSDAWLVKTDALGNIQWTQTYGEADRNLAGSLVETYGGGYIIVGSTGVEGYGSFTAGLHDILVIKTDEYGNMEWSQTYGEAGGERARSVIETSDGGYVIAGYTGSFGAGNLDFWLIKTN